MAEPHPARSGERPAEREDRRSLFQKLVEFIRPGPDSTDELIGTLAEAEDNEVIDAESRVMLEGVLRMADMTAGDAMVAAPRMDLLDIDAPYEELLLEVIRTAHSRFPVYQGERENIIGILLAKDLLKLQRAPDLSLRTLVRPALFVPENKDLQALLREFRATRNHMAIVVDEYGGTSGLVTFEDIIEQIIGDIEDEFDEDESADNIFPVSAERYRINATTEIEDINQYFGTDYSDEEADTIGGLVIQEIGHLPVRGEKVIIGPLQFTIARADNRRLHTLMAMRVKEDE